MFDLSKIRTKDRNPRRITPKRLEDLKRSLKGFEKMLSVRPIVYDPDTMEIIGGNQRYEALLALKYKTVPDEWIRPATEFTEEEKRRFIVIDNESFGYPDEDILFEDYEISELEDWGVELESPPKKKDPIEDPLKVYGVIVECKSERDQKRVLRQLQKDGFTCKPTTRTLPNHI